MTSSATEFSERATFAVKVDFVRGTGDPTRPFKTIVALIESLHSFDRDLVRTVDVSIVPVLVLDDVEANSIKAWVTTMLQATDDSALRSGDWRQLVGSFLVKGKRLMLKRLQGRETITEPRLLEGIRDELYEEAEKTAVRGLPGYAPMPRALLAAHIADITQSMESLEDGDTATFEGPGEDPIALNKKLRIDGDEITRLLASRVVKNKNEMVLKVKKPDFIGSSMWEFVHSSHSICAKIASEEWLAEFRRNKTGVVPGSALRAIVEVEVAYDDQNDALPPKYTVLEVLEVLPPTQNQQLRLEAPGSEVPPEPRGRKFRNIN